MLAHVHAVRHAFLFAFAIAASLAPVPAFAAGWSVDHPVRFDAVDFELAVDSDELVVKKMQKPPAKLIAGGFCFRSDLTAG